MPAVVRIGDSLSTGHPCDGTTTLGGANQGTVKANGILIAVIGAPTVSHNILVGGVCVPHVAALNAGSGTVKINGIGIGRVGDSADAGAMTSGSPDVSAG
jgi:uncharacterized Zn-binding protein involved in type VI secretion